MKSVIAVAVSLLLPVVPVLAQSTPDQTQQAAAIAAKANASADQTQTVLQTGTRDAETTGTVQPPVSNAGTAAPTAPPSGEPYSANLKSADTAKVAAPPTEDPKKPSFFAKEKKKLEGFVKHHPVETGAIIGGLIGMFGGPAFFLIGASLGAVAGDIISHKFFKH